MPYLIGFTLCCSLIIAMGLQDIYVIKQGILRQNAYYCALTCSFCDTLLITVGITGAQQLIIRWPLLNIGLSILGIVFLLVYGVLSIKRALVGRATIDNNAHIQVAAESRLKTMLIAASFSLLDPLALITNFVILGDVANQLEPGMHWQFALGAISASFTWFFALATVAIYFSPLLQKKKVWQWMDSLSGCMMLYIAVRLMMSVYSL